MVGRRPTTIPVASSRPLHLLLLLLLLLSSTPSAPPASAWSPSPPSPVKVRVRSSSRDRRPPPPFRPSSSRHAADSSTVEELDGPPPRRGEEKIATTTTTTTTTTTIPRLSSAYDPRLPASLVGEAVRSAMRSDRGVCLDFSRDRYSSNNNDNADSTTASSTTGRSVSVVAMRGRGTRTFLDAKFSGSVPRPPGGGGIGTRTSSSSSSSSSRRIRTGRAFETAFLTAKGRVIDRLLVLYFPSNGANSEEGEEEEEAFLITSPGNDGTGLYDRLSSTIFPMDGVTLTPARSGTTAVLTLACSTVENARTSFENNVRGTLTGTTSPFEFPEDGTCDHYRVPGSGGTTSSYTDVYVVRHAFLSPEICHGYTLLFREGGDDSGFGNALADGVWRDLTDENNDRGPVGIGALEYDTLRVEAGLPGFGNEMTGDGTRGRRGATDATDDDEEENDDDDSASYNAKSNPLELHMRGLIDTDKGCYQGQEGVASVLKNKRGPPRQLYQVVFYDSENDFRGGDDDDDDDDAAGGAGFGLLSTDGRMLSEFRKLKGERTGGTALPNDTRQPRPGDDVYVLGSNDSIPVGKISDAKTIALALVKRPGPILSAMKERGLELPRWWEDVADDDRDEDDDADNRDVARMGIANERGGSGIMRPPPLDPLHNLEVVLGGAYTVGRLASVPGRRYGGKSSRGGGVASLLDYESRGEVVAGGDADGPGYFQYNVREDASGSSRMATPEFEGDVGEVDELLAKAERDFATAVAQAEAAAAEAKRKEDKMKLPRAEAAMASRRKKTDG
ncbi:hypothetical protein ACHAW5_010422 [Stephanodiscus triporus]|uniref:Uncharacterized protein n=1 Tax=Stephanodiscus triporus TaxID=2934178 RepID=A0ABD3PA19_9STRA